MNRLDLDEATVETLKSVLEGHEVTFAMLFGSGARGTMDEASDLDVVIEFEACQPTDEGYSEQYLELIAALDAELSIPVDVIDVHTMTTRFATVAFEEGTVLLGTETRKEELADRYGGEPPTLSDARSRVSGAVERLRNRSVG